MVGSNYSTCGVDTTPLQTHYHIDAWWLPQKSQLQVGRVPTIFQWVEGRITTTLLPRRGVKLQRRNIFGTPSPPQPTPLVWRCFTSRLWETQSTTIFRILQKIFRKFPHCRGPLQGLRGAGFWNPVWCSKGPFRGSHLNTNARRTATGSKRRGTWADENQILRNCPFSPKTCLQLLIDAEQGPCNYNKYNDHSERGKCDRLTRRLPRQESWLQSLRLDCVWQWWLVPGERWWI